MLTKGLSKAKITALAVALCMISMGLKEDGALASASSDVVYYTWPVPTSRQIDRDYDEGYGGIDIVNTEENTEVIAAREGVVENAKSKDCEHTNNYPEYCCNNGMGNYIKIRHEDGTYAVYSHLKYGSVTVSEGEEVEEGQIIGMMGSSGRTKKMCLHFSVGYSETKTINTSPTVMSYKYSTEKSSEETNEEGELWRIISETGVNFRSGAGTSFQAIGQLPYDASVVVVETIEVEDLQWGKTTYEGETGWFALKYAEITAFEEDEESEESEPEEDEYCDVRFDPNGGECEYSTYMYKIGSKYEDLPVPTRTGYKFVGWYTEPEEGTAITMQDDVVEDVTIYAHWI